ncbi:carbon starvation CstA family protein [Haloplanus aerogenes]|uniref:Carbon starvation protein A n=1 Tax=Haloplanus aerogenes TaxID=660522 RepID=A0A3M0CW94_9EURY|nr:carbon starvation protein A [Haloplanus aerogenes]AZH23969.1 carbon starvation protein A [Haloplanus aerogenes]RMB13264.1 carbon starvation protein CstA [Haloplanus aerogenes]
MVQAITVVVLTLVSFTAAYLGYSRYLAQFVDLDDERETPAHKYQDGQEYVPSKKPVLLGHHYSSIAGGAPIVGPITATVVWGWVPAFLWVAIGNPLFGSVHDFMALTSSMRHEGKSIGYIIGEYVGERGKDMILWFAFLTIILVVAVFALVIALVFNAYPQAATASLVYIALALVFGVYLYQLDLPFLPGTLTFIAAVFAGVWVGVQYPLALVPGDYPAGTIVLLAGSPLPPVLGSVNIATWIPVILVYGFIASVLPVWVLLQPRDFLTSSLLYAGVGGTLLAVIVGTFTGGASQLVIDVPAYAGFWGGALVDTTLPLFPLLFVTIACGTISGFHSLVSSGTTAKQLDKESDARTIGYGGMLGEGLLATVAIVTVAVYAEVPTGGGIGLALPNFASGGGLILNVGFGISEAIAAPFMGLVLVSFLLTSTDTAVRLGRYMVEELVGTPETQVQEVAANRYVNAFLQVAPAYVLVASGRWADLWPLFGGANQTLAALALLVATIWLANWDDQKQLISTGAPMAFMLVITTTALLYLALYQNLYQKFVQGNWAGGGTTIEMASAGVQIVIALVLIWLALSLAYMGINNIRKARGTGAAVADGGEPAETDD